MDVILF